MNLRTAAFEQFVGPAASAPQLWRRFLGAAIVLVCTFGGTARIFGWAYGEPTDYGHWDLLVGRRAEVEVWPVLEAFLSKDGPGQTASK